MLYCREMSAVFAALALLLIPARAQALVERFVVLNTGIRISIPQVLSNVIGFLAITSVALCSLIFLLGAGQLVISHGDQTKVDTGKKMMTGSLMGLGLVLSAYAIVRTVLYFLYFGTA